MRLTETRAAEFVCILAVSATALIWWFTSYGITSKYFDTLTLEEFGDVGKGHAGKHRKQKDVHSEYCVSVSDDPVFVDGDLGNLITVFTI